MKKILVVDDTTININILIGLLSENFDILVATDGLGALDLLEEESIDLILLDVMMPNMDGFEVCKRIKMNSKTKQIPIIFITAKTDEDSIEKAYELGGSDYITKPFKPRELIAKINREFQLQDMINHLEFISSYDEMTGILNRRKFFELAKELFDKPENNLYAIMIDIDNFKNINDTYGHPFGDKILKNITKTISSQLNNQELFARLGGEEFVILTNIPESIDIKESMEVIRQLVENQRVLTEDKKAVNVTISQGIVKKDSNIKNLDHLLKKADDALYLAKGAGRNKVIFRT